MSTEQSIGTDKRAAWALNAAREIFRKRGNPHVGRTMYEMAEIIERHASADQPALPPPSEQACAAVLEIFGHLPPFNSSCVSLDEAARIVDQHTREMSPAPNKKSPGEWSTAGRGQSVVFLRGDDETSIRFDFSHAEQAQAVKEVIDLYVQGKRSAKQLSDYQSGAEESTVWLTWSKCGVTETRGISCTSPDTASGLHMMIETMALEAKQSDPYGTERKEIDDLFRESVGQSVVIETNGHANYDSTTVTVTGTPEKPFGNASYNPASSDETKWSGLRERLSKVPLSGDEQASLDASEAQASDSVNAVPGVELKAGDIVDIPRDNPVGDIQARISAESERTIADCGLPEPLKAPRPLSLDVCRTISAPDHKGFLHGEFLVMYRHDPRNGRFDVFEYVDFGLKKIAEDARTFFYYWREAVKAGTARKITIDMFSNMVCIDTTDGSGGGRTYFTLEQAKKVYEMLTKYGKSFE